MEISSSAFTALYLQLIVVVAFPILVLIYLKVKSKASMIPFFIGGTVYVLFSVVLLGIIGFVTIILGVSDPIDNNVWMYTVYQAVVAGLTDETGRFVAHKFFMRGLEDDTTPLFYATGHAAFEGFTFVAIPALSTIMFGNEYSALGLTGMVERYPEMANNIAEKITKINEITAGQVAVCLTERLAFFALHMALSVIIFYGVRKKRISFLWTCIVLRAISTIPSSLVVQGVLENDLIEVVLLAVITLFICYIALKLYSPEKKYYENVFEVFKTSNVKMGVK